MPRAPEHRVALDPETVRALTVSVDGLRLALGAAERLVERVTAVYAEAVALLARADDDVGPSA